jgi:hypothetical protein
MVGCRELEDCQAYRNLSLRSAEIVLSRLLYRIHLRDEPYQSGVNRTADDAG